jgi:16S rRNA (uracil1498-N3)-methyltransferase
MRLSRLFSPVKLVAGSTIELGPDQANYVARVLRLRKGEALRLFDGTGGEFDATIQVASKKGLQLSVGQHVAADSESPLQVQLIQCISRGERMDLVMQKSTELGVHRVSPAISDFSVIRLDEDRAAKRRDHWHKVVASACEQSGRNRLPALDMPAPLANVLALATAPTRLVLHPEARQQLATLPRPAGTVCILVGPEGGLSEKEYALAAEAGFTAISLGPRVLRTETAAIAALALVQGLWGDLGAG